MPNWFPVLILYASAIVASGLWIREEIRKAPLMDEDPGEGLSCLPIAPKQPMRDGCWTPEGRLTTVANRLTQLTGVDISDADVTEVLTQHGQNLRRACHGQRTLWEWHLQRAVVKNHIRRDVTPARLVAL